MEALLSCFVQRWSSRRSETSAVHVTESPKGHGKKKDTLLQGQDHKIRVAFTMRKPPGAESSFLMSLTYVEAVSKAKK